MTLYQIFIAVVEGFILFVIRVQCCLVVLNLLFSYIYNQNLYIFVIYL